MSKVFNITDKLSYEELPKLVIKDVEVPVNDDAVTMLKVMQLIGEQTTPADIVKIYELIIPEEGRKKIDKMKLNFADFQVVIKAAISLVTGNEMDQVNESE